MGGGTLNNGKSVLRFGANQVIAKHYGICVIAPDGYTFVGDGPTLAISRGMPADAMTRANFPWVDRVVDPSRMGSWRTYDPNGALVK